MATQIIIEFISKGMATYKNSMSKDAIEEEWLLIQAAQKNPSRFGTLYDRYYEQIFRFIYLRTADVDLCADICAETFVKALNKIYTYSYKGVPFSAWLYTIASNEIKQYYRKANKNPVVTIEDNFINNIKEEIDNQEELEINLSLLKSVINQLSRNEVEMVEMRFYEERSFKEIGHILNITENNAKVKMHRIVLKMKDLFGKLVNPNKPKL